MSECMHNMKVTEWGNDEKGGYAPILRRCSQCNFEIAEKRFIPEVTVEEYVPSEHSLSHHSYVDNCFACKIRTLELSTGDANGKAAMAGKKWDSENQAFADAVAQGVHPSGVFRHEIEESLKASEILGVPYDARTMMPPQQITTGAGEIMKEIGII